MCLLGALRSHVVCSHNVFTMHTLGIWVLAPSETRYGMAMGLFQIFRYAVIDFLTVSDTTLQPFTTAFPRADIHELLTPDLLHQVIKGTFKDHLVQWVEDYLNVIHGTSKTEAILDEIDRR